MLDGRRVAGGALLLLPAGLVAFFAFNSGGFYPGPPAYAAVLLCLVLLLRVLFAGNPLEGVGPGVAFVTGALALYALMALLSQTWSHAPGRALIEFDLALVYLLALVLFGTLAHSPNRLRWILRSLAVAILVICGCGLVTRLLPHLWPTTSEIADDRLSFPLTYWNALGLLGAFGVVLSVHFCSDQREHPVARVLAAASIPVLATTIYFTFSRGGIAGAVIGVIGYVLVARPKALLSAALACVPATAVAIAFAYDANLLATSQPTTPAALVQGRHVAVALIGAVVLAAALRGLLVVALDPRLARFTLSRSAQRRVRRFGWAGLIAAVVVCLAVFNGTISHEFNRFLRPASPGSPGDFRARLTDPGNNGRLDMWRVGWHQFVRTPVLGQGAGTFANTWAERRPTQDSVVDAHSLYIETLDELGVVGFVLLLGVIAAILIRTATRARGPDRPLYAAVLWMMLVWALHAGIDWDWEMPVVTLPFFALGGFMLSRPLCEPIGQPSPHPASRRTPPVGRLALGLGALLVAITPAYVWLSQRRLDQATTAFAQGDCGAATRSALGSISVLGERPEPYEVIGYCDIRRDKPGQAIARIEKAVSLDPGDWNYRYDLAVMRASAGIDPMPAAREALSLNPREPLVQQAVEAFAGGDRASWEQAGRSIADQFTTL